MSISIFDMATSGTRALNSTVSSAAKKIASLPKAIGSLPEAMTSTASSVTSAVRDVAVDSYSHLGKSYKNASKSQNNVSPGKTAPAAHDVILIGSPGHASHEFELSAKTLQKRYPGAEVIYPAGEGLSGDDATKSVMSRLKAAPIKNFVYTGHASDEGIWIARGTALSAEKFKEVSLDKAVIYGCSAGEPGGFGEKLANQNGAHVRAIDGTMQFSGAENGWANHGFKDSKGQSLDINKTSLPANYSNEVWGVPAHPWASGDKWVDYAPPLTPTPSAGPSPSP